MEKEPEASEKPPKTGISQKPSDSIDKPLETHTASGCQSKSPAQSHPFHPVSFNVMRFVAFLKMLLPPLLRPGSSRAFALLSPAPPLLVPPSPTKLLWLSEAGALPMCESVSVFAMADLNSSDIWRHFAHIFPFFPFLLFPPFIFFIIGLTYGSPAGGGSGGVAGLVSVPVMRP